MRLKLGTIFANSYLLPLAGPFLLVTASSCEFTDSESVSAPNTSDHVLFVGNSFTGINDGIALHFERLSRSGTPSQLFETSTLTRGGATLKAHYESGEVRDELSRIHYQYVVLQGDIPEIVERNPYQFIEYAALLDSIARSEESETILMMTWPYERLNWISLDEIMEVHRAAESSLGVRVAPVGLAFQIATTAQPELALFYEDNEHQNIQGTYLAAATVYATLLGKSPVELEYRPRQISPRQARFLLETAWTATQDWNAGTDQEM